jgi:hypothetical protein
METALALIYVLLQIISPNTESFTMTMTPDSAFYGTKQADGTWQIETGNQTSKGFFGDAHVEGRTLIINTKEGKIPFEAADMLGLEAEVDWKKLQAVGSDPLSYKIFRTKDQVEFIPSDDNKLGAKSVITKLQRRKPNKSEQATPRKRLEAILLSDLQKK